MSTVEHAEDLMRNGDFTEAKLLLAEILSEDPEDLRAICDIGIAYTETGENHKAIKALEHYVSHDVTNPYAWEALGCARFRTGELAQARSCLVRSLDLMPENPSGLRNLGVLHGIEGRPEEGLSLLRRSRDLAPEDYRTAYALAFALKDLGLRREAEEHIDTLLSLKLPEALQRDVAVEKIRLQLGWE